MAHLVDIGKMMVGALRHGRYGAVLEQQTGRAMTSSSRSFNQITRNVSRQRIESASFEFGRSKVGASPRV